MEPSPPLALTSARGTLVGEDADGPFAGDSAMSAELASPPSRPNRWTRRHLLGLEELSRAEIETILDKAEQFVEDSERRHKKRTDLQGKVLVNLFFEPSTRTRNSFSLAAKRLSADTID